LPLSLSHILVVAVVAVFIAVVIVFAAPFLHPCPPYPHAHLQPHHQW
jgi:hypothetical protein